MIDFVYKPFRDLMKRRPDLEAELPFGFVISLHLVSMFALIPHLSILVKKMEKAYGIEAIFKEHLPALRHGNDGLIFTCITTPYVCGTDERM